MDMNSGSDSAIFQRGSEAYSCLGAAERYTRELDSSFRNGQEERVATTTPAYAGLQ